MDVGKGRATTALALALALLRKEAELALLGDVAKLTQRLDGLLARSLLTTADNATTLGLHQVLTRQTTGSVLGSSVPDLSLCSNSGDLATSLNIVAVLASAIGHLRFYLNAEKSLKHRESWNFSL